MKRWLSRVTLTLTLALAAGAAPAAQHSLGPAQYRVPDGWAIDSKPRKFVSHTEIDQKAGRYCQLFAWNPMASVGNADQDFAADWKDLIVGNLGELRPVPFEHAPRPGWQVRAASAAFRSPQGAGHISLVTFSNGSTRLSFSAVTSAQAHYRAVIDAFFASIQFGAEAAQAAPAPVANTPNTPNAANTPVAVAPTGPKTTRFDDGWVSVEQPDWVEARKDALTVRILHELPDIRPFNNLDEATAFVWARLVAPRYSGITNLWVRRSFWSDGGPFEGKYFAQADARDAAGRQVHVALFKYGNAGRWIETVTPDKASFQRLVTPVLPQDGTQWDKLISLINLNRFAVSAADLVGTWGAGSGAGVQYVNAYTGTSAGMAFSSSTSTYEFRPDGTYTSVWKGAHNALDGRGTQFGSENSRGNYQVRDWEVTLTGRFQGATHTFAARFEAVKGGRVLHLVRGSAEELALIRRP
jgi:hypothetical protein